MHFLQFFLADLVPRSIMIGKKMEHQQSQTTQGNSVVATLFMTILCLLILLLLMPSGCCCSLSLEEWSQEHVYAADVNTVNPKLEGKLVKLKITEIHSDDEVEDTLFGMRGRFLVLSREVVDSDRKGEGTQFIAGDVVDVLLSEGMMDGIRTTRVSPAKMRSGAFTLLHAGRFLDPDRDSPLPPREQWPEVLRKKGEEPEPGVVLWRESESPGALFAHVRFRTLSPGILSYPLYAVARQRGNTLDFNDAHAGWLLQEDFEDIRDIGDMYGYDGLGLELSCMSAVVCTPIAWALLTLFIRFHRELSKRGGNSWISLRLAVIVIFLLSLYAMLQLSIPLSPIVLLLILLPLLMICLRRSHPCFSARFAALLYLPTIIFGLGAVMPYAFRWELRLLPAVLSVLSALVVVYLTRRSGSCPNKEAAGHVI